MIRTFLAHIQHNLNPLHVYCRLMDSGMNRYVSMRISRTYEILIYRRLNSFLIVSCFCFTTRMAKNYRKFKEGKKSYLGSHVL